MQNKSKQIYIAGPLFSDAQRGFLENLVSLIAQRVGLDSTDDIFLPHRDIGDLGISKGPEMIFGYDIKYLGEADVVVAILDGPDVDSGTAAEIGYAFAIGKPIFALLTDFRAYAFEEGNAWRINNMIWGMCDKGRRIFRKTEDLASAIQFYLKEKGK